MSDEPITEETRVMVELANGITQLCHGYTLETVMHSLTFVLADVILRATKGDAEAARETLADTIAPRLTCAIEVHAEDREYD